MVDKLSIFSINKPNSLDFPKTKTEVINILINKRKSEATKMGLTYEEYEKFRELRKSEFLKHSDSSQIGDKIVKVFKIDYSESIKNGKLIFKNQNNISASAYIMESGSKKPVFGLDFDKYTYAEQFKVRRIAYAHFDGTI